MQEQVMDEIKIEHITRSEIRKILDILTQIRQRDETIQASRENDE